MPDLTPASPHPAVVIGGGPAGLMAAEALANAGLAVEVFDAMPSVGRKFLLAGVGGMNITHSEPYPAFVARYAERQGEIGALLREFDAAALCQWIHGLGIETFVGTSGRVFPTDMKAAPLLRAWLKRLRDWAAQQPQNFSADAHIAGAAAQSNRDTRPLPQRAGTGARNRYSHCSHPSWQDQHWP